jgi:hypothetical protein
MTMNTVVLFGAGATKACGGPLTNEILPQAFEPQVRAAIEREYYIDLLDRFLIENFHVPADPYARTEADYPGLPLLISLIDTALERNQPMAGGWDVDILRQVRRALQYMVFALLEYRLRGLSHNYYADLFEALCPPGAVPPTVISLNYDIIADNTMIRHSGRLPEYGCDIATEQYRVLPHWGTLLKIHGSLNWSYCPSCSRLDLGLSGSGRTHKMLEELYRVSPLEDRYSCHGYPCHACGAFVEAVLITPTQLKDYRNPHVRRVWDLAEQALRAADRAIIVGYSLPEDDLDVIYLLQRGLGRLAQEAPHRITVVDYASDESARSIGGHPAGRRYRSLFGPNIDWQTAGFQGLIATLQTPAIAH